MKLSSYKRIYKTDYDPQFQDLVNQLAEPVNLGFDELYNVLNNNVNFADNINCTIASLDVTVDATGKPLRATTFKLRTGQTTLLGLIVINVSSTIPSTYAKSGIQANFTLNTNTVIINNIQGLTAEIPYTLTILAIG